MAGFFFIAPIATSTVQHLHDVYVSKGFAERVVAAHPQKRAYLARTIALGYIRPHDERCGHFWNAQ